MRNIMVRLRAVCWLFAEEKVLRFLAMCRASIAVIVVLILVGGCAAKAQSSRPRAAAVEHYNRGAALENSGDFSLAAQEYQAAIDADPSMVDAYYNLGVCLMAGSKLLPSGKISEQPGTGVAFQTYLALAPNGSHANDARKVLGVLGDPVSSPESQSQAAKAAQQCPDWVAQFDQIRSPEMRQAVDSQRQLGWDNVIQQNIAKGVSLPEQIQQGENMLPSLRQSAANARQCVAQLSSGRVTPISGAQCDHLQQGASALVACMCQESIANDTILATEGTLDILKCWISAESQSPSAAPASSPDSSQVDVRFRQVDSRPLTDAEMSALRNSLHWQPETAPLPRGGTARSNLMDDKGNTLGSILIRWDAPAASTTRRTGNAVQHFTVQLENSTSCAFLASAELDDGQGFVVVGDTTWASWLTLHQPERGQTTQAHGSASFTQPYPSLVFKPLTAYSTLSACMTPKNP